MESTKLVTYAFFTEIDQKILASLKYMPMIHFFAKLSDSNWKICILSFIAFLHFHIFNLSPQNYYYVKILKNFPFLQNVQKV